jgi:excisionase family DNA binding protein
MPEQELMTTKQAAKLLQLTPDYLRHLRRQGKGPPYAKLHTSRRGSVRYPRSEVMAWVRSRIRETR